MAGPISELRISSKSAGGSSSRTIGNAIIEKNDEFSGFNTLQLYPSTYVALGRVAIRNWYRVNNKLPTEAEMSRTLVPRNLRTGSASAGLLNTNTYNRIYLNGVDAQAIRTNAVIKTTLINRQK